ncbi:hypothetical protein ScPMuIL_006871 [Solemya velum]
MSLFYTLPFCTRGFFLWTDLPPIQRSIVRSIEKEMSRQPFYDVDPYGMQSRTNVPHTRDQSYMGDGSQFFADGRERFSGEIDRFSEARNPNFMREGVDTYEYSHSQRATEPPQQSYERGTYNTESTFGTSLGTTYDNYGESIYKEDRGLYSERFGLGTGFNSGGTERDPLQFTRSSVDMFKDSRLPSVGGFASRFGEGEDRMRGFQKANSPPRRQWDSLKRPYEDSNRILDTQLWSSSEPKYRQLSLNRGGGFESKPSMGMFSMKTNPMTYGTSTLTTTKFDQTRKFATPKFDPPKKFTPPKFDASNKFGPKKFPPVSPLSNKPKPAMPRPPYQSSNTSTIKKSPIPSVPAKSAMKPSAPVKPLGISNQGNRNQVTDKKKELPKTESTVKTSQPVVKTDTNAICPWLNAEEISAEELKEKFPKATIQTMEENCLKETGNLRLKENLPPDWIQTYHETGFPVFLHTPTQVVTLSKPYQLKDMSVRTHLFPVASIPCLQYSRELIQRGEEQSPISGGKSSSKLLKKDPGAEFAQAHPKFKGKPTTDVAKVVVKTIKKETVESTKVESSVPSNLDKKTKDAFLQFQEELESEMKETGRVMDEEEEYEKEMLHAFMDYQDDESEGQHSGDEVDDELLEALSHAEFLKYCERLFQFEILKLATVASSNVPSAKKTYYCLGKEPKPETESKDTDKDVNTVQLKRKESDKKGKEIPTLIRGTTKPNLAKAKQAVDEKYYSIKVVTSTDSRPIEKEESLLPSDEEELITETGSRLKLAKRKNIPLTILHGQISDITKSYKPKFQMIKLPDNKNRIQCAKLILDEIHYSTGFARDDVVAKKKASYIALCMMKPGTYKMKDMFKYLEPSSDQGLEDEDLFDKIPLDWPCLFELCDSALRMNPYDILLLFIKNSGMKESDISLKYIVSKKNKRLWDYTLTIGNPVKWRAEVSGIHRYHGKNRAALIILHKVYPKIKYYGQLLAIYDLRSKRKTYGELEMLSVALPKPAFEVTNIGKRIMRILKRVRGKEDYSSGATVEQIHREIKKEKAVDLGTFGSSSDSGILSNSPMGIAFEQQRFKLPVAELLKEATECGQLPYFLVGDEGFPLKDYLLCPYPGNNLPEDKRIFNYRLSQARWIPENSFETSLDNNNEWMTVGCRKHHNREEKPLKAYKICMQCVEATDRGNMLCT